MARQKLTEVEQTIIELEECGAEAEDATAKLLAAMGEMMEVVTKRSRLSFKAHRHLTEALKRLEEEAPTRKTRP